MGLFLSYLGDRGLIVIYTKDKERIRKRRRVREGRVRKLRLRHALLLFYLLIFDKAATPPHCYLLFLLLTSSTTTIQYVFFFFDHSSNEDEWKSLHEQRYFAFLNIYLIFIIFLSLFFLSYYIIYNIYIFSFLVIPIFGRINLLWNHIDSLYSCPSSSKS